MSVSPDKPVSSLIQDLCDNMSTLSYNDRPKVLSPKRAAPQTPGRKPKAKLEVVQRFSSAQNRYRFTLPLTMETAQEFEFDFIRDALRTKLDKEAKRKRPVMISPKKIMENTKKAHVNISRICEEVYGKDERFKQKFTDIALKL